jgi:hypothetical protein
MRFDGKTECLGSEMGHLAHEVVGFFGVLIFQLTVGRTHAAHRFDLTAKALCLSRQFSLPCPRQKEIPPITEIFLSEIIGVPLGKTAKA